MSVSGVILIALVEALGKTSGNLLGLLILLGAPICAACFTVLSRYFSVRYRPAEITFVMMNLSAVVFTTLAIAEQAYKGQLSTFFAPLTLPPVWMAILYLGVGSSVGAFFLTNYTLSKIEASQMSVFNNLTTLIAVVAAVVILREPLHWYHVVGGALIITGVWGTTTAAAKQKGR